MSFLRNSRMPDQWVQGMMASNPIRTAEKTGNAIVLCRLAFVNLNEPTEDDNGSKSYNTVLLLPWGMSDPGLQQHLYARWYHAAKAAFPEEFDVQGQPRLKHNPFHDQADKAHKYAGYTPGLVYISAKTQQKPLITDPAGNPIVDYVNKVYSGCWALVSLNTFVYKPKGAKQPMKGVSFGLQNVMIVADDEKLGGSAPPPADDFAGVKIDQNFDPSQQFGNRPAAPPAYAPPSAGVLPPPTPPPAIGAPPPAFTPPPYGAPPGPPAQQWSPPGQVPGALAYPPQPGAVPPLPPGTTNMEDLY